MVYVLDRFNNKGLGHRQYNFIVHHRGNLYLTAPQNRTLRNRALEKIGCYLPMLSTDKG